MYTYIHIITNARTYMSLSSTAAYSLLPPIHPSISPSLSTHQSIRASIQSVVSLPIHSSIYQSIKHSFIHVLFHPSARSSILTIQSCTNFTNALLYRSTTRRSPRYVNHYPIRCLNNTGRQLAAHQPSTNRTFSSTACSTCPGSTHYLQTEA